MRQLRARGHGLYRFRTGPYHPTGNGRGVEDEYLTKPKLPAGDATKKMDFLVCNPSLLLSPERQFPPTRQPAQDPMLDQTRCLAPCGQSGSSFQDIQRMQDTINRTDDRAAGPLLTPLFDTSDPKYPVIEEHA